MSNADSLNMLVTGAIWRAEQLDAQHLKSREAWSEVSMLEEQLATQFPVTNAQGKIARRGGVRAALKAGDSVRARRLAALYQSEKGAPKSFQIGLQEILDHANSELASHYPYAARRYGINASQDFATKWHQTPAPWT